MANPFDTITIIGVGLIGGSIAGAIRELEDAPVVRGIDSDAASIEEAISRGFLDTGCTDEDDRATKWISAGGSDLIILAVPVFAAEKWLTRIEAGGYDGVLTDTASTKSVITDIAERTLSHPERYIPGHPMSGSEINGVTGARANLFQGVYWILCPDERTDAETYQQLHELFSAIGARIISIDRDTHDDSVAVVSHVPHMAASALVALTAAHADEKRELLRLAAGGFKDTTRVASGSPELWCGIALDNREALADGLGELADIITNLEGFIREGDAQKLTEVLRDAADLRRSLPAKWVPESSRLVEVRIPMTDRPGIIAEVTGIAGRVGCNIESIEINHLTESSAELELILTDEGDIGRLGGTLIDHGFNVSFRPIGSRD